MASSSFQSSSLAVLRMTQADQSIASSSQLNDIKSRAKLQTPSSSSRSRLSSLANNTESSSLNSSSPRHQRHPVSMTTSNSNLNPNTQQQMQYQRQQDNYQFTQHRQKFSQRPEHHHQTQPTLRPRPWERQGGHAHNGYASSVAMPLPGLVVNAGHSYHNHSYESDQRLHDFGHPNRTLSNTNSQFHQHHDALGDCFGVDSSDADAATTTTAYQQPFDVHFVQPISIAAELSRNRNRNFANGNNSNANAIEDDDEELTSQHNRTLRASTANFADRFSGHTSASNQTLECWSQPLELLQEHQSLRNNHHQRLQDSSQSQNNYSQANDSAAYNRGYFANQQLLATNRLAHKNTAIANGKMARREQNPQGSQRPQYAITSTPSRNNNNPNGHLSSGKPSTSKPRKSKSSQLHNHSHSHNQHKPSHRDGHQLVAANPQLGCCAGFAKLLLFLANLVLWSAGIALGGWGIWSLVEDHKYNLSQLLVFDSGTRMSLFQLISWSFIVLGCSIILVGLCGCSAMLKNSRWILGLYIFLILTIFALDLATGLLAIIYQERLIASVRLRLGSKLRADYGAQASFTAAIDYLQTKFKCCGLDGHFDYDQSAWRLQRLGGFEATVARTCCHLRNLNDDQAHINPRPVNETMCQSSDVRFHQSYRYRKGCLDELESLIRHKIWIFTLACGAIGAIIMGSLMFATCFCRSIPRYSHGSRKGSASSQSSQQTLQVQANHKRLTH